MDDKFTTAVERIRRMDARYPQDAYGFINDAVAYTVRKCRKADPNRPNRHVSGMELIHGTVELAVSEFGPLAETVLREWGLTTGSAIGDIVFHLIREGIMSASERDSREDFNGIASLAPLFPHPAPVSSLPSMPVIDI